MFMIVEAQVSVSQFYYLCASYNKLISTFYNIYKLNCIS